MKRLFTFVFSLMLLQVHAQQTTAQQIQNEANSYLTKATQQESLNDKLNFEGFFSGLASFAGNTSNTLTFQLSPYSLDTLINPKSNLELDMNYNKNRFLRDFQLNLGFTPNSKSLYGTPVDFQSGFTYAIINNKGIPKIFYQKYINDNRWINYTKMLATISKYAQAANSQEQTAIQDIINNAKPDYTKLPDELKKQLEKDYNLKNDKDLASSLKNSPNVILAEMKKMAKTRTQLVFNFNSAYDFQQNQWGMVDASLKLSVCFLKSWKKTPSFTITESYSDSFISTIKGELSKSEKRISSTVAGFDFIFAERKSDESPIVEMKFPAVSVNYQLLPVNSSSSAINSSNSNIKVNPTASLSLNLSQKFTIPIVATYDVATKTFWGGFKVQMQLK